MLHRRDKGFGRWRRSSAMLGGQVMSLPVRCARRQASDPCRPPGHGCVSKSRGDAGCASQIPVKGEGWRYMRARMSSRSKAQRTAASNRQSKSERRPEPTVCGGDYRASSTGRSGESGGAPLAFGACPMIHGSNCQSPRAQRCWRTTATS